MNEIIIIIIIIKIHAKESINIRKDQTEDSISELEDRNFE